MSSTPFRSKTARRAGSDRSRMRLTSSGSETGFPSANRRYKVSKASQAQASPGCRRHESASPSRRCRRHWGSRGVSLRRSWSCNRRGLAGVGGIDCDRQWACDQSAPRSTISGSTPPCYPRPMAPVRNSGRTSESSAAGCRGARSTGTPRGVSDRRVFGSSAPVVVTTRVTAITKCRVVSHMRDSRMVLTSLPYGNCLF